MATDCPCSLPQIYTHMTISDLKKTNRRAHPSVNGEKE